MPNIRTAPYNVWDEMDVDNNYANAAYPLTNTQTVKRSRVWRSTSLDTGDTVLLLGTGAAGIDVRSNFLALFRHNLFGCTINVSLYDTPGEIGGDAPSDLVWSSGDLTIDAIGPPGTYDWGHVDTSNPLRLDPLRVDAPYVVWFDDTESFRQVAIEITAVADAFVPEVGRFFLGNYLELQANPRFGAALGVKGNGDQARTRGGSLLSNRGELWKTVNYDLGLVQEDERAFWLDMMAMNGLHRDFFMSVFPEEATRLGRDYTGNYKFTSLDALELQVSYRTKRVVAEEC